MHEQLCEDVCDGVEHGDDGRMWGPEEGLWLCRVVSGSGRALLRSFVGA